MSYFYRRLADSDLGRLADKLLEVVRNEAEPGRFRWVAARQLAALRNKIDLYDGSPPPKLLKLAISRYWGEPVQMSHADVMRMLPWCAMGLSLDNEVYMSIRYSELPKRMGISRTSDGVYFTQTVRCFSALKTISLLVTLEGEDQQKKALKEAYGSSSFSGILLQERVVERVSAAMLRNLDTFAFQDNNNMAHEHKRSSANLNVWEEGDKRQPSCLDRLIDCLEHCQVRSEENLIIFSREAPSEEYAMELLCPAVTNKLSDDNKQILYPIKDYNFTSTRYIDCKVNIEIFEEEYECEARLEGLPGQNAPVRGYLYNLGSFPIVDMRGNNYAIKPLCPSFDTYQDESFFFEKAEVLRLQDNLDFEIDMKKEALPNILVLSTSDHVHASTIDLTEASGREVAAALWAWYKTERPGRLVLLFPDVPAPKKANPVEFVDFAMV